MCGVRTDLSDPRLYAKQGLVFSLSSILVLSSGDVRPTIVFWAAAACIGVHLDPTEN